MAAKVDGAVKLAKQSVHEGKCVIIGLQSTGPCKVLLLCLENKDWSYHDGRISKLHELKAINYLLSDLHVRRQEKAFRVLLMVLKTAIRSHRPQAVFCVHLLLITATFLSTKTSGFQGQKNLTCL
jgi:hypothetical protein